MRIHIVSMGETPASIARQYGISLSRLLADNGLPPDQPLAVGQALIITLPEVIYRVQPGDTLYGIAAGYGLPVIRLIQNNPSLAQDQTIQPGQQLTISFRGEPIREIATLGFAYPYINRAVLRESLPYLSYLAIFSYGFREDGSLIVPEDERLIRESYRFGTVPVLVLTSIGEDGGFSSEKVSRLLGDPALQETVLSNLLEVMTRKGYGGLDADFEFIPPEDRVAYQEFLTRVREKLSAAGLLLSVDLAPKISADQPGLLYEAHDYPAIGAIAHRVHLMTYEWGYTYGPPMAVAPLNAVRRVVEYGVSEIPPEKILMGIPNYGYDWALPYRRGITVAENLGNQTAVRLAGERGAEIRFDANAQSPYFYYTRQGQEHVVWFEDVRSIQAKLELAEGFGLQGVFWWNVMRPFRQNWALLAARYRIHKEAGAFG